tara:strand:- start:59 stop:772 length:714 start_codon:yes stop_codon:yes gene_type:complete
MKLTLFILILSTLNGSSVFFELDDIGMIELPSDWEQIPNKIVQEGNELLGGDIDYAFQPKNCGYWFQCDTYLGVDIQSNFGKIPKNEILKFSKNLKIFEDDSEVNETLDKIDRTLGTNSSIDVQYSFLNETKMIMYSIQQMSMGLYDMKIFAATHFTKNGYVSLMGSTEIKNNKINNEYDFNFYKGLSDKLLINQNHKYNNYKKTSSKGSWQESLAKGFALALAFAIIRFIQNLFNK